MTKPSLGIPSSNSSQYFLSSADVEPVDNAHGIHNTDMTSQKIFDFLPLDVNDASVEQQSSSLKSFEDPMDVEPWDPFSNDMNQPPSAIYDFARLECASRNSLDSSIPLLRGSSVGDLNSIRSPNIFQYSGQNEPSTASNTVDTSNLSSLGQIPMNRPDDYPSVARPPKRLDPPDRQTQGDVASNKGFMSRTTALFNTGQYESHERGLTIPGALDVAKSRQGPPEFVAAFLAQKRIHVWTKIQQEPYTYVMSMEEYMLMLYFAIIYQDEPAFQESMKRFWSNYYGGH